MDKVVATAEEAVADTRDGATLAVGGFGLSGVPNVLIDELYELGVSGLKVVSNNCGAMDSGLAVLLSAGRISRVTGSYIGGNREFARQYLAGELDVEMIPQGTLAERLRAGGCGIPAFYTPAGVGTQVADGGLPWRYDGRGGVALASPPKEVREFDGTDYVLEHGIRTDFALVRAARGTGTGIWSSTSPAVTSTRWRRWPGRSRSPRSRSWSNPVNSTRTRCTCPGSSSSASCPSPLSRPARSGSNGARSPRLRHEGPRDDLDP